MPPRSSEERESASRMGRWETVGAKAGLLDVVGVLVGVGPMGVSRSCSRRKSR